MNRLKELRQKNGVKQKDIAAMLGVTAGAVSQWESGRCLPNAVALMRLSKLFGVVPEKIIEEDGENSHS